MIPTPLHRHLGAEHRVNGRAQRFRAIDDEQAATRWIDTVLDQVLEQILGRRGIFRGALAQRQHVFAPLPIHAHRSQHALVAEVHPVDVDDQQFDLIEAALQQLLQRGFGSFDGFPAHRRSRHPHRVGHLRNHFAVASRGNAVQQDFQHTLAGGGVLLHGLVGGDGNFFVGTATFVAQSRPVHFQLALLQTYAARLGSMPHQVRGASLALLRWSGDLRGRKFEYGFDAGASHHVDQFVDGHAAVLDQFHHGQQRLAVADQKFSELAVANLSLLVNRMVISSHGGSPFQGFVTPILFRIRGNRRFNLPLQVRYRHLLEDCVETYGSRLRKGPVPPGCTTY